MDSRDAPRVTTLAERPELTGRVHETDESLPVCVPDDPGPAPAPGRKVEAGPTAERGQEVTVGDVGVRVGLGSA